MPAFTARARRVSMRRIFLIGLASMGAVAALGFGVELYRFGATDAATASRLAAHVQREFRSRSETLVSVGRTIAEDPVTDISLQAAPDDARPLFDRLSAVRNSVAGAADVAVTVYDSADVARAWSGRPSDITADRIGGGAAFFVTRSPLGLRIVHTEPVVTADGRRLGSVAAEDILSPAAAAATMSAGDAGFTLATPIADVALRLRYEGAGEEDRAGAFLLRAPDGAPLAEASVEPGALRAARNAWRRVVAAAAIATGGLFLLLLIGPLLDQRSAHSTSRGVLSSTLGASALVAAGALAFWIAVAVVASPAATDLAGLLSATSALAALAALWTVPAVRLRAALQGRRRWPAMARARFVLEQLAAGLTVALLTFGLERAFRWIAESSAVDLRHFSLHPWDPTRLVLFASVLALSLSVLWTATLIFVAAWAPWRLPREEPGPRVALLGLWILPSAALVALSSARGWAVPSLALLVMVVCCGLAAIVSRRVLTWHRHAPMSARILTLFLAFLFPAVLLYPSLSFYTERETRQLIATQFAPEAQQHVEQLKAATDLARAQIDDMRSLAETLNALGKVSVATDAAPGSELAFEVWRQTALASQRLASAVELYDRDGDLVSRFGLNFPEFSSTTQRLQTTPSCQWDLFGEAQPFGSEERNMLHAERGLCLPGPAGGPPVRVGSIVLHVLFDYRSLPFIRSQSPYFELFRTAESLGPDEGTQGGNVEVAIYGWGLHPTYTSGRTAWSISDEVFARVYDVSRTPFWTRITRGDTVWDVHFTSDRSFIYALGYPILSAFDRLVHLAELMTLAGVAFALVLLGAAGFTRLTRAEPQDGRALLREIRASFYRKLFLAFVLASIVPVLTLAFVIRAYFADLLRDAVQDEAARTTAVAQRIIQQSDSLWRRGDTSLIVPGSDDVMVLIGQVIDQDVNIYEGAHLFATSERDLFTSGLLPTRTPDDVYRAIVLERRSSFVDEDRIGAFTYMIAAAPVRAGERDAILTVPLTNRQREIDREIDDLDRGVHLAALFFILTGAGIGLWLAERIADPVRRLTRATQRIAAGDFDARIGVRSADELRRLVDAFNGMAAELKAQRVQLERTHRLEAWAEMARQVAHEIKNPLTPIQLSAEHLRRVHADRGEPLSPVLEHCVESILGQVRLLRQISSEFSSFASSPTAKRAAVDLPDLVAEVVDPYRTGLAGRIALENRVAPPLPPVYVDGTLIARALSNIVENALHAMPGEGRLSLDAAAADGFVTLAVADTGVGMDADALARVFEPYFSTKTTGTGLGMPIARRNIELNEGSIEIESEKGRGTRVLIRLPIAAGATAA